jgi:bifunctional non-homologous end joining protein LigD
MPLDVPPPRGSRFGSPLVLRRVHWVRPELVAEIKYLTWTDDDLLRQVVYEGPREDKPAGEVRRAVPYPPPFDRHARLCDQNAVGLADGRPPSLPGFFSRRQIGSGGNRLYAQAASTI